MRVQWLWFTTLVAATVAQEPADESSFPPLYHLDDYSRCLSQKDGLYCLGTFQLSADQTQNPIFNLMKEYSDLWYAFDRTRLHRGYCVSSRCPSAERPARLRFERCVAQWSGRRALNASLHALHYCRTHAQHRADEAPFTINTINVPQLLFLAALILIVCLNLVGTLYDFTTGDDKKKNRLLMSCSVRSNWDQLTTINEKGDGDLSTLTPVRGLRVLIMIGVIFIHCAAIHSKMYLYNPLASEEFARKPLMAMVANSTITMYTLIVLSSFLCTHSLLKSSRKQPIGLDSLPKHIIKRFVRILPVHLLVVGYAATWWPRASDGPLWSPLVDTESAICRHKFWAHALHINNIVSPDDHCLVQTWYLAVDLQLYILGLLLIVVLARWQRHALSILAVLFVAACLLNVGLAYAYHLKALIHFSSVKGLQRMFHGEPSFYMRYTGTWNYLPSYIMGQLLAHLYFKLQEQGFKPAQYKWLGHMTKLAFPAIIAWLISGYWIRDYTSPASTAAYAGLEVFASSVLASVMFFGILYEIGGPPRGLFAWRGWYAMSEMSLVVLMLHWCVNMNIVASRPTLMSATFYDLCVDSLITAFSTYLLAVPVTILVEKPIQRLYRALYP